MLLGIERQERACGEVGPAGPARKGVVEHVEVLLAGLAVEQIARAIGDRLAGGTGEMLPPGQLVGEQVEQSVLRHDVARRRKAQEEARRCVGLVT